MHTFIAPVAQNLGKIIYLFLLLGAVLVFCASFLQRNQNKQTNKQNIPQTYNPCPENIWREASEENISSFPTFHACALIIKYNFLFQGIVVDMIMLYRVHWDDEKIYYSNSGYDSQTFSSTNLNKLCQV